MVKTGLSRKKIAGTTDAIRAFHAHDYLRHNARRLEHLASLSLDLANKTVLEVGAGIGDMTHFFTDRNCQVTITEGRDVNIEILRERYPDSEVRKLDLEKPDDKGLKGYDIVFCYGLLYHLSNPELALQFLSSQTKQLLLLETCVSFGASQAVNQVAESARRPTQAVSGTGCRPTRSWLTGQLKKSFNNVYIPVTQPHHEQFVLDWTTPDTHTADLSRAVFIGSHETIISDTLTTELPDQQSRH